MKTHFSPYPIDDDPVNDWQVSPSLMLAIGIAMIPVGLMAVVVAIIVKYWHVILLAATLTLCSCSYPASYNHVYGNQRKTEKSRKHAVNKFNNRRAVCIRTFK